MSQYINIEIFKLNSNTNTWLSDLRISQPLTFPHVRLNITAIVNKMRKIYADRGDIKVLTTMGIVPIPPIGRGKASD